MKGRGAQESVGVSEMMGIRETGGQVTRGKYDKKGDRGVVRDLNTLHLLGNCPPTPPLTLHFAVSEK